MTITRITKKNEKYFKFLFAREARTAWNNLIRLGVINDEGLGVGALSAYIDGGTVHILSLYILPDHRRKGYGKALMETLESALKDQGIDAMATGYFMDDASEAFTEAMGFELFDTRALYGFTLGEVFRSPLYKRHIAGKKVKMVKTVKNLTTEERKAFERKMGDRGYDPAWTTVYVKNGKYSSSLLASHAENVVTFMLIDSESRNPRELLDHIRALVLRAEEKFPDNKDLEFRLTIIDSRRVSNISGLMGSRGHVHVRGYFRHAVKLL